MNIDRKTARPVTSAAAGVFGLAFLAGISLHQAPAAASPLNDLLGTWGGSGMIQLQDGTRERIQCNAYYTGGGSTLGLAIRCSSQTQKIEIRAKLSENGGRLAGHWEERTYNAEGDVTGQVTNNRITMSIRGGVTGSMVVSYGGVRQNVSISTQGIGLKGVDIGLRRR